MTGLALVVQFECSRSVGAISIGTELSGSGGRYTRVQVIAWCHNFLQSFAQDLSPRKL